MLTAFGKAAMVWLRYSYGWVVTFKENFIKLGVEKYSCVCCACKELLEVIRTKKDLRGIKGVAYIDKNDLYVENDIQDPMQVVVIGLYKC